MAILKKSNDILNMRNEKKGEVMNRKEIEKENKQRYMVRADHPVNMRIDKIVTSLELVPFKFELKQAGYENIESELID